jgi:hypothetical protein
MQSRTLWLLFGCGALAACSSDPVGGDQPSPAPTTTAPAECKGPGYREQGEPQQVDSLVAELVDLEGDPVANELVQVCGLDLCTNGESQANGSVVITPGQRFLEPAFKFGEGRVSARFASLLPPDEAEIDLGVVRTVRLPDLESSVPLVAGATAEHGGLSLTLAAGAKIDINGLTFRTAKEKGLRAVAVALESAPDVVAAGPELELVYAATPVETRFCPFAELAVENSEGWEPGTEVEVWLHGVDITEEWAPYGGWAQVSLAVVSADGERIETTEPGLPELGVLGFRRVDAD